MTITLKSRQSRDFPVLAAWKIGSVHFEGVYASKDEAVDHLSGRFGKITVIDRIAGRQKGGAHCE